MKGGPHVLIGRIAPIRRRRPWLRFVPIGVFLLAGLAAFAGVLISFGAFR